MEWIYWTYLFKCPPLEFYKLWKWWNSDEGTEEASQLCLACLTKADRSTRLLYSLLIRFKCDVLKEDEGKGW